MIIDTLNRWVQKSLFTIGVLLFCAPLSAQESEGVRFVEKPFKDVLAQAKAENKMVFIDCYTSWCGPCKMMAAKEFPKKVMGDYFNAKFVSSKFDMEKGEGPDLSEVWDVNAYPTFLVMNNDGEILFRIVGYLPAEKFIEEVETKLAAGQGGTLEARYKAVERSPEFIQSYLEELNKAYRKGECMKVVREYLSGKLPEMLTDTLAFNLFLQHIDDPYEESFLYVSKNEEAFVKRYGTKASEKVWTVWSMYPMKLFYFEFKQGRPIDAKLNDFMALMKKNDTPYREEIECSMELTMAREKKDTLAVWNVSRRCAKLERISDAELSHAYSMSADYLKDKQALKELEALVRVRLQKLHQKKEMNASASSQEAEIYKRNEEAYNKVLDKIKSRI